MGRGNQFSSHPGNVRFYAVVDDFTDAYYSAQTKFAKSRVVQQAWKNLSKTARFLRKDSTTKNFFLISDADARQKISHAIRYRYQNNGGSSSRTSSPDPVPSPIGATDGADFFNNDQKTTSPCLQSKQSSDLSREQQQTSFSSAAQPVVIELFSDEELTSVLGDPHEYENMVYPGNGFEWLEISSLSPLTFPESINENEVLVVLPLSQEETKDPYNDREEEEPRNSWDGMRFSIV
eukprot:scaffold35205_cov221-Amphora_coffeaeformis.AAC.2